MLEPVHQNALAGSPLFLGRGNTGFTFRQKEYDKKNGSIAEYLVCSSLQQLLSSLIKRVRVKDGSSDTKCGHLQQGLLIEALSVLTRCCE